MILSAISKFFLGDLEATEQKKFGLLAIVFGLIIGVYWVLRSYKNPIFAAMVGVDSQPIAKWVSLGAIVVLIFGYTKLVDRFEKYQIFQILCGIYGLLLLVFAAVLASPSLGLANAVPSPWNIIGWAWYVFVESWGSILVMLFWAFSADIFTPEAAKRGYSMLAFGAQFGGLLGALFVKYYTESLGIPLIIAGMVVFVLAVALLVRYFMRVIPACDLEGYAPGKTESSERGKVSFWHGVKIIIRQPYLAGIFGIIACYEIVVTMIDFQMLSRACQIYGSPEALGFFYGTYAIWLHAMSLIFILFGIGNIERYLGLRASLVVLPIVLAGIMVMVMTSSGLDPIFYSMILIKGLNFSINEPTKEQLYIPTTQEAKYKTKAWIEMFGKRFNKAAGAGVNLIKRFVCLNQFIMMIGWLSLGIIGVWLFIAGALGKKYQDTIDKSEVIG